MKTKQWSKKMTKMNLFAVVLVVVAIFAGNIQAEVAVGARSWLAVGNFDTDDSVGWGATFEYIGWGTTNLEVSADYISFDRTVDGILLDVDLLPIALTAKFYSWEEETFGTYFGVGFAYYMIDADGGKDLDDVFGWHLTTGSDIYLTEVLSLVLEGKYQWVDDSSNIDLEGWSGYAGLKLFIR
jgi:outer membrane protein W